jgi:hypothetical protein
MIDISMTTFADFVAATGRRGLHALSFDHVLATVGSPRVPAQREVLRSRDRDRRGVLAAQLEAARRNGRGGPMVATRTEGRGRRQLLR